jgi:glycosyltransferase involved in cell wall biosynthesis
MRAEIVIPCFNEAGNLMGLIDECHKTILESNGRLSFILVDNGSTDSTNKIFSENNFESKGIRFVSCTVNMGYGGGIVAGLKQTTTEIVGWTHADLQTPLIDCLRALEHIEKGHSFAKGKRDGRSLIDRFFSIGMGVYESCLFRAPLWEVNAQPTLFTKEFFFTWKNGSERKFVLCF